MHLFEVVAVYFVFLVTYPVSFIGTAIFYPMWSVPGVVVTLGLWRFSNRLLPIWVALWLMPGTVICGAAAVIPLPVAAQSALQPGGCSSPATLVVCALLNLLLAYRFRAIYSRLRRQPLKKAA
jgi:hypothetical protein